MIEAMGAALKGSDRPLVITSGTGMGSAGHGKPAIEDVFDTEPPEPARRVRTRRATRCWRPGVNVSVMRLPQVHDTVKQGLITPLVEIARAKGVSAYVGDGSNRWPAAHVADVARLYRLALEQGESGARYHAVAEEGITARAIAERLAAGLGVPVRSLTPEEAPHHFGWMALFAGLDLPASSAWTRARLGWHPTGPGLIADLEAMDYSPAA